MSKEYYSGEDNEHINPNSILTNMKIGKHLAPSELKLREFALYRLNRRNPYIEVNKFKQHWAWIFNYPDLGVNALGLKEEPPFGLWVQEVALNPYADVDVIRWLDSEESTYEIITTIPAVYTPHKGEWLKETGLNWLGKATEITKSDAASRPECEAIIKEQIADRINIPPQTLDSFNRLTEAFKVLGIKRNIPDWMIEYKKQHPEFQTEEDKELLGIEKEEVAEEKVATKFSANELADGFVED